MVMISLPISRNGIFLYPLKAPENPSFLMFSGVKKETNDMKWVK